MLTAFALSVSAQQENVTIKTGTFGNDWESLSAWECPEWFKDAKFGIWAHWGPQCQAEDGARYFMALGNHHDNFDLWNSPYQEWNSVNVGPKKDFVKGWSDACKAEGLPLGVSIHASHAWTWLEPSQKFDGINYQPSPNTYHPSPIFDLQGRHRARLMKGLNIVGGQKVIKR